jgi:Zn/Cd-binding protein ZinT
MANNSTAKELLTQNIKGWMQLDKEIKILQKELKERKKKILVFSNQLVELMKSKDLDCVDINDGKILFTQSKTKTPLNKKYLLESLQKYFADNRGVQVDDVVKFVLENRDIHVKEGIRLKPLKD